jgi:tRNA(Arg) A34 adenosine deaminase TadA
MFASSGSPVPSPPSPTPPPSSPQLAHVKRVRKLEATETGPFSDRASFPPGMFLILLAHLPPFLAAGGRLGDVPPVGAGAEGAAATGIDDGGQGVAGGTSAGARGPHPLSPSLLRRLLPHVRAFRRVVVPAVRPGDRETCAREARDLWPISWVPTPAPAAPPATSHAGAQAYSNRHGGDGPSFTAAASSSSSSSSSDGAATCSDAPPIAYVLLGMRLAREAALRGKTAGYAPHGCALLYESAGAALGGEEGAHLLSRRGRLTRIGDGGAGGPFVRGTGFGRTTVPLHNAGVSPSALPPRCHPLRTAALEAVEDAAARDRRADAEDAVAAAEAAAAAAATGASSSSTAEIGAGGGAAPAKRQRLDDDVRADSPESAPPPSSSPPPPPALPPPPPSGLYICTGADAFLTTEPSIMDAMALVHSRVSRIFYAAPDPREGVLGGRWGADKMRQGSEAGIEGVDGPEKLTPDVPFMLHEVPALNHHYTVWRVRGFDVSEDAGHVRGGR